MPKEGFYAVARGRTVGVFSTWNECKNQVDKFENARYKKFNDLKLAEAFIQEHSAIKPLAKPVAATAAVTSVSATGCLLSIRSLAVSSTPKAPGPSWRTLVIPQKNPLFKAEGGTGAANGLTQGQSRSISTTTVNSKRKFKVSEDRVVPMKRRKYENDRMEFNKSVDLTQFKTDEDGYVVVYTDGACKANGRRGAKAGIGVWFDEEHPMNISLPVEGNRRTNNTAEIQAAEKAILKAKEAGINKLNIKTDSQFVINCITKWIHSWKKNAWKLSDGKPVKNREDLEKLSSAAADVQIKWSYVPGHKGHHGNEQADLLAVAGSEKSVIL